MCLIHKTKFHVSDSQNIIPYVWLTVTKHNFMCLIHKTQFHVSDSQNIIPCVWFTKHLKKICRIKDDTDLSKEWRVLLWIWHHLRNYIYSPFTYYFINSIKSFCNSSCVWFTKHNSMCLIHKTQFHLSDSQNIISCVWFTKHNFICLIHKT